MMEETPIPPSEQQTERDEIRIVDGGLSVDVHKIRFPLPSGEGGENPANWKEVWEGVQRHLRRICVDLPGALADSLDNCRAVIQGVGKLVKGMASLPAAIVRRIGRAQARADAEEDQRQMEVLCGNKIDALLPPPDERLQALLAEYRLRGMEVTLVEVSPGEWLLTIVRPEYKNVALEAGTQGLLEAKEFSEMSSLDLETD